MSKIICTFRVTVNNGILLISIIVVAKCDVTWGKFNCVPNLCNLNNKNNRELNGVKRVLTRRREIALVMN